VSENLGKYRPTVYIFGFYMHDVTGFCALKGVQNPVFHVYIVYG
jgi:hypothetical protein